MKSRGTGLNSNISFLAGVALGAGLMALLDPRRGHRRRAYLRAKLVRGVHVVRHQSAKQLKRMKNEVVGSLAEALATLREWKVPDDILAARVRAQLGHVVRNFRLLNIDARDGHVTIWGPVLRGERGQIIDRLDETRGVRNFYVQVEEHDSLDHIAVERGEQQPSIEPSRVAS